MSARSYRCFATIPSTVVQLKNRADFSATRGEHERVDELVIAADRAGELPLAHARLEAVGEPFGVGGVGLGADVLGMTRRIDGEADLDGAAGRRVLEGAAVAGAHLRQMRAHDE